MFPFKDQASLFNLRTCPEKETEFNNLGLKNVRSEDRFLDQKLIPSCKILKIDKSENKFVYAQGQNHFGLILKNGCDVRIKKTTFPF